MNRNALIVILLSASFLTAGAVGLVVSDDSEGVALPSADFTIVAKHKTYYTSSPSESFWLGDINGREGSELATIIAGSSNQGNLSVDRGGAPSWITYELPSIYGKQDVKFTITAGAVCNDTFWILFKCFNNSARILVTFELEVLDSGSVIPEEYNTFILKFDTKGGSSVAEYSVQSKESSHTFDLSNTAIPTKSGYKFVGWSDNSNGNTVLVNNQWTMTITNGTVVSSQLYAVYEVSSNGGVDDDEKIWIPNNSIYDLIAQAFMDTTALIIIGLSFLSFCWFVGFVRRRGGYA